MFRACQLTSSQERRKQHETATDKNGYDARHFKTAAVRADEKLRELKVSKAVRFVGLSCTKASEAREMRHCKFETLLSQFPKLLS